MSAYNVKSSLAALLFAYILSSLPGEWFSSFHWDKWRRSRA